MQVLIEILRRVVPLALCLVGGWMVIWPGPDLLVVEVPDFQQRFQDRRFVSEEERGDPQALAKWIVETTDGRTVDVQGEQFGALAALLDADGPELAPRRRDYGTTPDFIYRLDEAPFDSLGHLRGFQYLRINGGTHWLTVNREPAVDIQELPGGFAYPRRTLGLALLASALLLYFFLPRRKPGPGEMRYARFAAIMGADLMGLALASFFFLLSLLIVFHNAPGQDVLGGDGGWIWLMVPMWFIAAISASLLVIGGRFSLLGWRLDESGLTRIVGGCEQTMAYGDIASARYHVGKLGRWLGTMLILFGNTPGQVGQGILVAGRESHSLRLEASDGRKWKMPGDGLDGFQAIQDGLAAHGVVISKSGKKDR